MPRKTYKLPTVPGAEQRIQDLLNQRNEGDRSAAELIVEEKRRLMTAEAWAAMANIQTLGAVDGRESVYLRNRIEHALDLGIAIGQRVERRRIVTLINGVQQSSGTNGT